ncbi:MAG: ASKHA domain-containing protein, partial [bacterium]|nr:ASKHA domain-containing protein [bacterium]
MPRVVIEPEGKTIDVTAGETLMEAMSAAGIAMDAPCGGLGTCGKCRVKILQGESVPDEAELRLLSDDDLAAGVRLACRLRPEQDMRVHYEGTLDQAVDKLFDGDGDTGLTFRPSVSKLAVTIEPPSLSKQWSMTQRLRRALAERDDTGPVGLRVLSCLSELLDTTSVQEITAVMRDGTVIAVESGNTVDAHYAVAVDIGTTTLVVYLLDMHRHRLVDAASATNPQAACGADVISRIDFGSDELKRKSLRGMVLEAVNTLIRELAERHNIETENIYEAALVGNTCMTHMFWELDARSLATAPYTAVTSDEVCVDAVQADMQNINPAGNVFTLPNIAGFVGADTVGVILATDLDKSDDLKLAIDIGTNGEMVLGNRNRMMACSTAAGPAFEGARISQGMRAIDGAIDRILIENDRVVYTVIGGTEARGFCGSGIIDAVAVLRRCGFVDETGRILPANEAQESRRFTGVHPADDDGTPCIVFGDRADGSVRVTQRDVREVQLAKAAIRAGVNLLLKEFGCDEQDISAVLLAGAFGNYIDKRSALEIGLLPAVEESRIISVGNAAGIGAVRALASLDDR